MKNKNLKLSKNFYLSEMTVSNTALKYDIPNIPNEEELEEIIKTTTELIQPIRNYIGKPITINSGFRSKKLNKKIGGSKTSQHVKGQAVDSECYSLGDNLEYANKIIESDTPFDQLILEVYNPKIKNSGWVHVSRSDKPRYQKLYYVQYKHKIFGIQLPKLKKRYYIENTDFFSLENLKEILNQIFKIN